MFDRLTFIVGSIFALFLLGQACSGNQAAQSARQAEDANTTIEANILKLKEAREKFSADPSDQAALSVILKLLKDGNGINRANAAAALGEVGEKYGEVIKASTVPILIEMVERGDEADRYAALKALRAFGPHANDAIPILRNVLMSANSQQAWLAAEALGRMKAAARDAVPDLWTAIQNRKNECRDDELHMCRFAIQALGSIGPAASAAKAGLISLLTDANPFLRAYAAVALIRIQPNEREAVLTIASLLRDKNLAVRRRTIWELRDIGEEARPVASSVRTALRDQDEAVRRAASELLESLIRQ
jgi:HEAT repeat protein